MASRDGNARRGHAMERLAATGILVAVASLAAGGCAVTAADGREAPTHRWVSKTVESEAQYRYDNKACALAAGDEAATASIDEGEGRLRRDAPAFIAYERCMGERGYQLATY